MEPQKVEQILAKAGAVIVNSHFVYTSGKHSPAYINKDAIYPHAHDTSSLCRALAWSFKDDLVDVVIAPAVGAIILSQWIAYHLTNLSLREVLGVYADKGEGDNFVIKRGYEKMIPGKRVLVVEDLFTTGGSAQKVVGVVRSLGGTVVGVAGIANRGKVTSKDVGDVPKFITLVDIEMAAYDEADCPLCKQGVPVNTEIGHGRQFMARKSA